MIIIIRSKIDPVEKYRKAFATILLSPRTDIIIQKNSFYSKKFTIGNLSLLDDLDGLTCGFIFFEISSLLSLNWKPTGDLSTWILSVRVNFEKCVFEMPSIHRLLHRI